MTPTTASAGGTGTGTGIATGTAADEVGEDTVVTNTGSIGELWCETALDPSVVYIAGDTSDWAISTRAISRIDTPSESCPGFPESGYPYNFLIRPTDGKLLFVDTFDHTGVHVFVPDESGYMAYDNDDFIPTTPCGFDGPGSFVVHPVDGTIVYNCANLDSDTFYDEDGDVVLVAYQGYPMALGADGTFLTVNGGLFVVPPHSAPIPLDAPDALATVIAVRAHDEGFWIAHQTEGSSPARAFVDFTGHVTLEGEYAITLGPPQPASHAILGGDGDLVYVRFEDNMPLVLIRSQLLPGEATVIYNGIGVPEDGSFLFVTELFTGP